MNSHGTRPGTRRLMIGHSARVSEILFLGKVGISPCEVPVGQAAS